ncbi:thiamine phosphate synthase [Magnetospira sp. QH-2]|uniref:thiamine phosphate synthase n=1 Tax=Magnetospira sp. (strain QH-2) TaxID=1288970 RepID=UPI0003E81743|nr:thiamine phosphate synthase [Magnetospira sp. QH-2]CCQ75600.1 putative Thiamine monophosphate synthase [Magnetospira sp. QH-2]
MPTLTDLARRLNRRACSPLPPLILMTDDDRLPDPSGLVAHLPKGSAILVRSRKALDREQRARRLIPLCRPRGIKLLVADDIGLAMGLGLDGLHIPEAKVRDLPLWHIWRRPGFLVTTSAHSLAALHRAARAGVDAALLSPVFSTGSHPNARQLGPTRFGIWTGETCLAIYGLGGIDSKQAARLLNSGAVGMAGIDLFKDISGKEVPFG